VNFTQDFGVVTPQDGNAVTYTLAGLLVTDQVHIECVSAPPIGFQLPNVRVSAPNTLSLYFNTSRACTLGILDWRLTIIRLPSGYANAETTTLAGTITPAPAVAWLTAVDNAITNLKAAGIWQTFDLFYGFAAVGANARTYNWVNTAIGRLTANGTINYVDNGYTASDGTTGWFSSSFPVNSGNATDGNAEFGYFCLSEARTENVSPFGTSGGKASFGMQVSTTAIGALSAKLNTSSAASFSSQWGSSVGHFVLQQNDNSAQLQGFLDGTLIGTSTQTHSTDTGTVQIFKNSAGAFTSRQTAFVHYGSKLTAPQQLILSKVLYNFLTAIGIKPKAGQIGLATGPTNLAPYKRIPLGPNGNDLVVPITQPGAIRGLVQGRAGADAYALIRVNDPNYLSLWRHEVHQGDHTNFDTTNDRISIQSSVSLTVPWQTTCDTAYSFWIENGTPVNFTFNDIITAMHDQTGGVNTGPTFAINPGDGRGFVWCYESGTYFQSPFFACAQGQWHSLRVAFRYDNAPNGFIQVWLDGVQIWNRTGVTHGTQAGAPFYLPFEYYRSPVALPGAVWTANYEFDATGALPFASRVTNPLPVPPLT
jgi:hypothetical protein